jgi:hypothetical protein
MWLFIIFVWQAKAQIMNNTVDICLFRRRNRSRSRIPGRSRGRDPQQCRRGAGRGLGARGPGGAGARGPGGPCCSRKKEQSSAVLLLCVSYSPYLHASTNLKVHNRQTLAPLFCESSRARRNTI